MDTKTYSLQIINKYDTVIMEDITLNVSSIDDILVIKISNIDRYNPEESENIINHFSKLFPEKCVIITHDDIQFMKLTEINVL